MKYTGPSGNNQSCAASATMEMVEEGSKQAKEIKVGEIVEEEEEEEGEDRISALPDCLLVEILDLLSSTQSAIRTGTLSKRWKYLWTSVPTLIFSYYNCHLSPSDFVSFVDEQLKLRTFAVHTGYDVQFEMQFHNWIRYATSCYVEELELIFHNQNPEAGAVFTLNEDFFINSCFTVLKLRACIFNPIGVISWENLRRLVISGCKLGEDAIENMLSGSPQLESLILFECYGYRRLDITSKSVKKLVFNGYYYPDDDEFAEFDDVIEINAPNILSIKIHGMLALWKIVLLNVSSLVEAELDYRKLGYSETTRKEAREEMLKGFIQILHHVKELRIGYWNSTALIRLEAKGFSLPSNVKFPDDIYSKIELYESSDSDS